MTICMFTLFVEFKQTTQHCQPSIWHPDSKAPATRVHLINDNNMNTQTHMCWSSCVCGCVCMCGGSPPLRFWCQGGGWNINVNHCCLFPEGCNNSLMHYALGGRHLLIRQICSLRSFCETLDGNILLLSSANNIMICNIFNIGGAQRCSF